MKKIEKDILLKDLDYVYSEVELKKDKLNSIISLFIDEEPDAMKERIDKKVKETEEKNKKIEEEELNNKKDSENNDEINEDELNEDDNIENKIEEEILNDELPKDIKTLYRKIVMIIHPDKNRNKYYNEIYSYLYKRIIKAKNENDKVEILYIAYKLKIPDVYDVNEEYFNLIKKKIKEKEIESNNIQYNSYWVWYHTENTQLKKIMVQQISNSKK